eukprot:3971780-Pleurochrysis_carterae.AAC.2
MPRRSSETEMYRPCTGERVNIPRGGRSRRVMRAQGTSACVPDSTLVRPTSALAEHVRSRSLQGPLPGLRCLQVESFVAVRHRRLPQDRRRHHLQTHAHTCN